MEAQYEEFEGWEEDISKVKRFAELPEKAQTYIRAIEELSSVRVEYIGNGPNKDDFVTC
jgi:adenylosuccinate synthase